MPHPSNRPPNALEAAEHRRQRTGQRAFIGGVKRNLSRDERRTAWEKAYPGVPFGTLPPIPSTPLLDNIKQRYQGLKATGSETPTLDRLTKPNQSLWEKITSSYGLTGGDIQPYGGVALGALDKIQQGLQRHEQWLKVKDAPTQEQADKGLEKTGSATPFLDRLLNNFTQREENIAAGSANALEVTTRPLEFIDNAL